MSSMCNCHCFLTMSTNLVMLAASLIDGFPRFCNSAQCVVFIAPQTQGTWMHKIYEDDFRTIFRMVVIE